MGLIEKISNDKLGCQTILLKDEWQVVKINYSEEYGIDNCTNLYMNKECGLAITLLKGEAILVTENSDKTPYTLNVEMMKSGSSYYIHENLGYTIIMNKNCELFSVENPQEQPLKVKKRALTNKEIDLLIVNVNKEFNI